MMTFSEIAQNHDFFMTIHAGKFDFETFRQIRHVDLMLVHRLRC